MRYRIVLDETIHRYEAVIYRDFPERAGGKNASVTIRKLSSMSEVYSKVSDEMRDQSAFVVKRIEEAPTD